MNYESLSEHITAEENFWEREDAALDVESMLDGLMDEAADKLEEI